MKQTRQIYSGINEEGYPCAIAAEGILLSDLAKTQAWILRNREYQYSRSRKLDEKYDK